MKWMKHAPMALVCALMVTAGLAPAPASAEEETEAVQAGVASVDITPEMPIRLSGYGARQEEATEIAQPLYAKALAFGGGDAPLSVLMSVDLIGAPGWLTDEIGARLNERFDLDPANLAICATHTHAGPVIRRTIPDLFGDPPAEDEQGRIDRYTDALVENLENVAAAAVEDMGEARLAWAQGSVDFAVNRRVIEDGVWTGFGVAPEGPVDHDVPVLAVHGADGALRAVLFNYACHCTTLTGTSNVVHGDWAGEAAARIEAAHEGVTALVAIGCGGDANPYPRGSMEDVERHGATMAEEVSRVLADSLTPLPEAPRGARTEVALPFADGGELPYTIQTWTFGDELAMVFLPGEVTVDYALRFKRELDEERLWVNAYANGAPCYIASSRVIAEGGYEADSSMQYYGQPGPFDPVIEDIIVEAVHGLLTPAFAPAE